MKPGLSQTNQMSKKSMRRSSGAIDARSRQTPRQSPRLLLLQPIDGLGSLSTVSMKSGIRSRPRVFAHQAPLRRSTRFLSPEKLKRELSSQKSSFCRKSVEVQPRSASITSNLKEAACSRNIRVSFCRNSQLKQSISKSGMVLEDSHSGLRRSLRLVSQSGINVSEILQGFPDGNPRRQSMRLLGVAPVFAENVKARFVNPKAIDEVQRKKPLEVDCRLVSVTTKTGKECNEPEAIAKSNPDIAPKKKRKPMSSQIRRSSPRLLAASNGVMKRGAALEMTDKGEEVAGRVNANRGDLVSKSMIKDGFEITKTADLQKAKGSKMEEDDGIENRIEKIENEEFRGTVAWTKEQEEALQKAYLMAKPSPHFWKKVSRMVPGKSAQECFDKIHASIVTPLSPQPRSRTRKKSVSPIPHFNLLPNILPGISETEAGRLKRCRTKKLAAHKTLRYLLRKHSLTDQTKAADHFSLLESPPINIAVNVLNNISNSPCEKLSANSKMFSRFKPLTSSEGPSPHVLKPIKNRALHDRYIDQLHHREARRVMVAKKSKFDDLGNGKCLCKPEHGALKAAKMALISDAKSFINHFQHAVANPMDELDADYSDDADEDIDVSDFDE